MSTILKYIEEVIPDDDHFSDGDELGKLADKYWELRWSDDEEGARQVFEKMSTLKPPRKKAYVDHGGTAYFVSWPGTRYPIDNALCPNGYVQFDTKQDAYYYGMWVSPEKHIIVCFAENDLIVTMYSDPWSYNLGIDLLLSDPGIQAVIHDHIEKYYDKEGV